MFHIHPTVIVQFTFLNQYNLYSFNDFINYLQLWFFKGYFQVFIMFITIKFIFIIYILVVVIIIYQLLIHFNMHLILYLLFKLNLMVNNLINQNFIKY